MKLVVVDDDPDTNALVEAIGKVQDVEVISFPDGLDALKYLNDHDADVVILDLELPIIDGLRVAREIRKNEELHPDKPPVKLVFFTGHEIDDTIQRVGEKVGVDKRHMIHKPADLCGLVNDLKNDFGQISS